MIGDGFRGLAGLDLHLCPRLNRGYSQESRGVLFIKDVFAGRGGGRVECQLGSALSRSCMDTMRIARRRRVGCPVTLPTFRRQAGIPSRQNLLSACHRRGSASLQRHQGAPATAGPMPD